MITKRAIHQDLEDLVHLKAKLNLMHHQGGHSIEERTILQTMDDLIDKIVVRERTQRRKIDGGNT